MLKNNRWFVEIGLMIDTDNRSGGSEICNFEYTFPEDVDGRYESIWLQKAIYNDWVMSWGYSPADDGAVMTLIM